MHLEGAFITMQKILTPARMGDFMKMSLQICATQCQLSMYDLECCEG
jgi:hypothetical protein